MPNPRDMIAVWGWCQSLRVNRWFVRLAKPPASSQQLPLQHLKEPVFLMRM